MDRPWISSAYRNGLERACALFNNTMMLDRLANSRWIVTGGTGWLGSVLVLLLAYLSQEYSLGIEIEVAARNSEVFQSRFRDVKRDGIGFVQYEAETGLPNITCEPDYIVHTAGNADPRSFVRQPVEVMTSNIVGCQRLLDYLRFAGHGRLVLVSSGEVYGELPYEHELMTENDSGYVNSMNVRACYQNAKRASETLTVSYAEEYQTDSCVARVAHMYGPSFRTGDSRAIPCFLSAAANGDPIVMNSAGVQIRSYTYELDVATGLLFVSLFGGTAEAYNVASSETISIRGLAEQIAQVAGVALETSLTDTPSKGYGNIPRSVLDNSKLKELGWKDVFNYIDATEASVKSLRGSHE